MSRFADPHSRLPLAIAAAFILLLLAAAWLGAQPGRRAAGPAMASPPTLTAFRSDDELRVFLRRQRAQLPRTVPAPPAMVVPAAPAAAEQANQMDVSGTQASANGITNNQEAGVDEGDIVKLSGDWLVILRRGRLFTVSLAGGGMRPTDWINAFPPGVDGRDDWYDEMLTLGDRIIVIGYSYARGGTEINRFRLSRDGRLRFEDAYDLRSNDYYSSRNYASRLIGGRLIFYTPLYLNWEKDPFEALPAMRRWNGRADAAFRRIVGGRQVYIPPRLRNGGGVEIDTLHSVTTCDLAAPVLDCKAVGVLGPGSRTFYVSGNAVYLWMSDAWSGRAARRGARALLYRLPLGGEAPTAIAARGAPVDQFSFREAGGKLDVLVRSDGGGDAMWRPEVSQGDVALLRLPIGGFGDGSAEAPLSAYRPLLRPGGDAWSFHNRFVGPYFLYGGGSFGGDRSDSRPAVYVVPVAGGAVTRLVLSHPVERIEPLGGDAMVIGGSDRGLGFSTVNLAGVAQPRLGDVYNHPNASEGETRSHAFFYSPDPDSAWGASGMLGLPVARKADPAFQRFFGSSAAMLFLRRADRRLSPAGELAARQQGVADDGCTASCVDWYGNARPIFVGPRTFALLGYELVEGRLDLGAIRETGRVSFAPGSSRH